MFWKPRVQRSAREMKLCRFIFQARQHKTHQCQKDAQQYPHLMVAGSEIPDVGRLKIADCRTAFLMRVTGSWVVVPVMPSVMQEQKNSNDK